MDYMNSILAALAASGQTATAQKSEYSGHKITFADKAEVRIEVRVRSGKTTIYVGTYGVPSRKHFVEPKAGYRWPDIAARVVLCAEDYRRSRAAGKADAKAEKVVDALEKSIGKRHAFRIDTDGKGGLTLSLHKAIVTEEQIRAIVTASIACGLTEK